MKFSKLFITLLLCIYASAIFAFQLDPDSGASQFVGSIIGEHFITLNAFSAGVLLVSGMISGLFFKLDLSLPGFVKLAVTLVVSFLGAFTGWYFALGIFIDEPLREAMNIAWQVAGGSTLFHGIIKEIGFIGFIKGLFTKS